ncbi:MAG: HAD-IA family hydrolase [Agathobacter rectalis]
MVEHGKPAPDVYEFACSELKLAPEECMAVEDSPNGVKVHILQAVRLSWCRI